MNEPLFICRQAKASDLHYVMETWVKSNQATRHDPHYQREQRLTIEGILNRPGSCARVAHTVDDEDAILGWAIYQDAPRPVIYYCYVRDGSRRIGIARALLASLSARQDEIEFTHKPTFRLELPPNFAYVPERNFR